MSPRDLRGRVAALALAAALAVPGAALARKGPAPAPSPWEQVWVWLAGLLAGPAPAAPAPRTGLTSAWGKAGSTIDPDGVRTAFTTSTTTDTKDSTLLGGGIAPRP